MQEDHYISIIHKKLSGDIDPSEAIELETWLNASSENQLLAESVKKAWELSSGFSRDLEIDLDTDFAILEKRIEGENTEIVPLKSRRYWLTIAATFVLIVVTAFVINNFLTSKVEWLLVETSANETQTIILSDGSKVILNENSILKYPESFTDNSRNLNLGGEAYFEVEQNPEAPFVVETKSGSIEVLGTSFNVRDYDEDAEMQVLVNTGIVKMRAKGMKKVLILEKAEKGVFKKKQKDMTKISGASQNDFAWHSNRLVFVKTPIKSVIRDLEKYYKVQILCKNETLLECPFTNTFNNKELDFVLKTIKTVYGLNIEIVNDTTYIVSGGSCR